jgi:hypothetical protein
MIYSLNCLHCHHHHQLYQLQLHLYHDSLFQLHIVLLVIVGLSMI